jgi:hypothetical protein
LEAAFRALPISSPGRGRIPVEWTLPELVRELASMRYHKREGRPWGVTNKKLVAMKKYAKAIRDEPSAINHFPMELRILVGAVAYAEFPPPPRQSGQPEKHLARKVARITAERFFFLTGRMPTRITSVPEGTRKESEFVRLLAKVYAILNIPASAESQAKDAITFVTKNYPRN